MINRFITIIGRLHVGELVVLFAKLIDPSLQASHFPWIVQWYRKNACNEHIT